MNAQRHVALLLAAALAVVPLVGCGSSKTDTSADTTEQAEQSQIANPFVDCESAYDAAQLAGFEVTFPESVPGYSERQYQAIEGQMVQCLYSEGDATVLIRKAVDDGSGDISGDYTAYSQTVSASVGDVNVTEKGDNDLVYVAYWTRDGYLFAIDADEGLDVETIEHLVGATM